MVGTKEIKTALISVFHKDGLEDILKKLNEEGVKFLSTGGTQQFIESLGYECQKVRRFNNLSIYFRWTCKNITSQSFWGILARRDLENDKKEMVKYEIPEIDLVIVDLYPFEQTVASGANEADIIEKIDIGGISLIRAGAKNFNDVLLFRASRVSSFVATLNKQGAKTGLEDRRMFAERAFGISNQYDKAIHNWLQSDRYILLQFR